ncbi:MAG: tRNA 2-thiocytidine(32) synthetase TtcA [Erysipelotrichaceae bacterium]|nr:tRNA 2-thiocytidine(32) synthetase TtcA [Erysipelotrichaceae bacterium]
MKPLKRVLGCLRKADNDFKLISDGDRIAVGLSGGKDSSALLYCLNLYKQFSKKQYEIVPVYIDLGFENSAMTPVLEYFEELGCPVKVVKSQILDILNLNLDNNGTIQCSLCAKLRKGALVNAAREAGCNKIALGHHGDDAVETLLLNMIHGGRIATFSPNTYLSNSGVIQLRPLIYALESDIRRMVNDLGIPVYKNTCPRDGYSQRQDMKDLLKEIYKKYPQARNNFQLMLRNIDQLELLEPVEEKSE